MIYSVFGDESHDEKRERVYAVAGLFGSDDQWDSLAKKWTEATSGEIFHAAEWQTANRHKEYRTLTEILAASGLIGWGAVLSLINFFDIFDNAADDFLPYYICFIRLLNYFGSFTSYMIHRGTVKFTLDQNLAIQHNATAIYDLTAKLPEWEHHEFLESELSFSTRKNPRIQAADLWTHEVMKHMENRVTGPKFRPTRLSLQTLRSTKRFGFDMLDSGHLQAYKTYAFKHPRAADIDFPGWLEERGLIDNTTNRVRYEVYLREVERRTKSTGAS